MHPSAGGGNNNDDTITTILSPSNFLPPSSSPPPKNSMDELWKDITLSSLTGAAANNSGGDFSNIILQDFLAKPFNKESGNSGEPPRAAVAAPPLPSSALSLTSASDFECIDIGGQNHRGSSAPYFEESGSPVGFPSFCKKRVHDINENSRDRRHKRMMKNRESAARSRARRQAYTNELEFEIAHLQKENAILKRQQEKLLSAPPTQLPKKNTLQRSFSAPF